MNGIQTKRAVYYGLLIACLAGALLTVFLPFTYDLISGYRESFLAPVSILHYITNDITAELLGWYSELADFFDLFFRIFALWTVILQVLSLLRVLGSLNDEVSSFVAVRLGMGPVLGICLFALLLVLGILNHIHLHQWMGLPFWLPPIWPLAGLLLNCASLRLARALNP